MAADPPPDLIGELALRHKMVTQHHLRECLAAQRGGEDKPLGQLLVERDYITIGQLNYLVRTQSERLQLEDERAHSNPEEALFGKLAVHQGFVSEDQLQDAIREKALLARIKITFRLGEILIKKGHLTPHQVQLLLGVQNKRILACRSCSCRFNIEVLRDGDGELRLDCSYCGAPLSPLDPDDDSVVVKASLRRKRDLAPPGDETPEPG